MSQSLPLSINSLFTVAPLLWGLRVVLIKPPPTYACTLLSILLLYAIIINIIHIIIMMNQIPQAWLVRKLMNLFIWYFTIYERSLKPSIMPCIGVGGGSIQMNMRQESRQTSFRLQRFVGQLMLFTAGQEASSSQANIYNERKTRFVGVGGSLPVWGLRPAPGTQWWRCCSCVRVGVC